jgi:hypothetical protein
VDSFVSNAIGAGSSASFHKKQSEPLTKEIGSRFLTALIFPPPVGTRGPSNARASFH